MTQHLTPAARTRAMIAEVAARHGLTYRAIVGTSKTRHIVRARVEAIEVVARAKPHLSTPQLGRIFGRDHSTVLHALGRLGRQGRINIGAAAE